MCGQELKRFIDNGTISINDSRFFPPGSSPSSDDLTIWGSICPILCGGADARNGDWFTRFLEWMWPVLLVLGVLYVASGGPLRWLVLFHTMGNPIGTFRIHISKVFLYWQCHIVGMNLGDDAVIGRNVRKDVAFLILAITELLQATQLRHPDINILDWATSAASHILLQTMNPSQREALHQRLSDVARNLRKQRSREVVAAWIAVVPCVLELIMQFVPGFGHANPSGVKVAAAFLLSWLLPLVLLSGEVGSFRDFEALAEVLGKFFEDEVRIMGEKEAVRERERVPELEELMVQERYETDVTDWSARATQDLRNVG
jgi:hypothetical protein